MNIHLHYDSARTTPSVCCCSVKMIIEIIADIKMTIGSVIMISTSVEIVDIIRVAMVTVMVYDQGCSGKGKYLTGWEKVNLSKKGVLSPKFSKIFVGWGKDYCTYNFLSTKLEGRIMTKLIAYPIPFVWVEKIRALLDSCETNLVEELVVKETKCCPF